MPVAKILESAFKRVLRRVSLTYFSSSTYSHLDYPHIVNRVMSHVKISTWLRSRCLRATLPKTNKTKRKTVTKTMLERQQRKIYCYLLFSWSGKSWKSSPSPSLNTRGLWQTISSVLVCCVCVRACVCVCVGGGCMRRRIRGWGYWH